MAQTIHILHDVVKFRIAFHALLGTSPELVDKQRMAVRPFRVFRFGNFVVRQRVFECAFAELRKIAQARQDNIGGHAVQLRRAARDAIKFLDG